MKLSIVSFFTLIFLGWYGGIDYEYRRSFNAAYVAASIVLSLVVFHVQKEEK